MRRSTGFPAFFSLLRSGSAGAILLATILSCSDSTSPSKGLDGVIRVNVASVQIIVPDSLKQALAAENASMLLSAPAGVLANVVASPGAAFSASSCGSGDAFVGYTKSKVAFAPEAIPSNAPFPLYDEGFIPDKAVPLGFNFKFEGNTYDKVNVYFNGFLLFGPVPSLTKGYSDAGFIAATTLPNNLIALSWTDWDPSLAPDGIRFETRGSAPNRRFVLQFNNVPEYNSASRPGKIVGTGRLTSQVVLSEGSNDITVYTDTMSVVNSSHFVTQGIENALGTEATYDSVQNVVTGVWSRRVRNSFKLGKDAVRFSLIRTKDEEKPTITAPDNLTQGNDPGLASAVVAVGSPVAVDNCQDVKVSGVRSDGAAIDAPYPVGVTTITWTATDAAGNTASVTQTVTVIDVEPPVFPASAQSILTFNATSPAGAVVTYDVSVTDNVGVTSLLCEPASGSVFHIGSTQVNCIASDAAGNTRSKSFPVYVNSAREQLAALLGDLTALNLPNGTAQPLINQLRTALREPGNGESTCKKLADFISLVEKKEQAVGSESADLIADASRIMVVLECPGYVPQAQPLPQISAQISAQRF